MDKDPKQVADLVNDAAKKEKEANELSMQQTMMLIMNAGNAKAFAKEAIDAAKKGDFDKAEAKIKEANEALIDAHNTQTGMLTEEARGNHAKLTLLVVHAQDHLMTAITYIDLAQEIVEVYKQMAELKN
ncbi:PTS lactose/cellobiose transporter subunit IIA [Lactobacillus jensenii]|jgi:PTS system, lactose/cellobiose-specific IIA subunit|uniref:PTS lactose/cellobiose transporter subunit IIA n=1 Tax=Lactobacillus jensenii TaxID=109790 RepID=A0A5N1IC28_LACJE|nr:MULTISPECIES: PTS lactose/cellobiose transporter subunit IIA [Lactobacillus]EEQ68045.1 PTS system, Lactose/Cellobiose specific IIA subunit [Lactobacillus jensenii 1153]APT14011.1 PTS lactose/cellobiose transporter subunit IIA [Lactobacillus jensenii]EEQ23928.1 PTS system, Lactose/Cellobiose specific IIA subunit [Lactobacillus jensenii 269-3]EEX26944.1 lichenan-specific phosphotransferase enzyme IIA component [Lactobacillus jensenii SJ-7A-US]KAA9235619.1 PTS lactose/cellobiose transporter su